MLRFKEFILERTKSPMSILNRVDRRYGRTGEDEEETKNSDGSYNTKSVETREIPLHDYDEDEADDVWNAYDKHTGGKGIIKNLKTKTFKIKDLKPMQTHVRIDDKDRVQQKIDNVNIKNPIRIATYNGNHYILNGHHSIFAAKLRGDKEISGEHVNLDN